MLGTRFILAAVAFAVAPVAAAAPVRAQEADLAAARPDAYAIAHVVKPLREIAHIKARNGPSAFCLAFNSVAAPAAISALTYERRLLDTAQDLSGFRLDNELAKNRSKMLMEDDLAALADSARDGHDKLMALRQQYIGQEDPTSRAVVQFVDAVDGAKGRQLELARDFAHSYGRIAELESFSIANMPADSHGLPTHGGSADLNVQSPANAADPFADFEEHSYPGNVLFAVPGDEDIGHDLERAAGFAMEAETLGHC